MRPADTHFIQQIQKLDRDRDSVFGKAAFELCKGYGLEIGAVNCPFDVDAEVVYMDQVGTEELLKRHEHDQNVQDVVPVSLISRDLDYDFIGDGTFDFVVASHMLEHTANPARTISELAKKVKQGGVLYFVVPHKDFCFDRDRPVTTVKTLAWKYLTDVRKITVEQYLDFMFALRRDVDTIDEATVEEVKSQAQLWYEGQIDFHVHTFTQESFWAFLEWLAPRIGCEVVHKQWQELNIHGALRKISAV
jgi:SAM-dependent methyltransferase